MMVLAFILVIVSDLTLIFSRKIARTVPINYGFLLLFTAGMSYIVAAIASEYDPTIVFMAMSMTVAIVASLFLYASTTKSDFTMFGGMIFVVGALLSLFILFALIISFDFYSTLYCALVVVLYGFYLIYDI
jgi:FtsH-binding integral membrane protein